MELKSQVESTLFVAGKPLSPASIARAIGQDGAAVEAALRELASDRRESGVVLLESDGTWMMSTNPENAEIVRMFLNAEMREKLTDATVETLAIIAYRQPISKAEIEAIRGVNCQYSIRALLIRGLISKESDPKDGRQLLYQTTHEFLEHMGLSSVKDLPDFETFTEKVRLPEKEVHEATQGEAEPTAEPADEPTGEAPPTPIEEPNREINS